MAADVITRFKLETTQFDSKLRDTAKALQDIARTAASGGKDFNNFSQKAIDTARALSTVQSGATNTKDKLRDLVGSYNDAVKAYDKLSDAAKKGEFGQAMAESLRKLQQDIKQTKDELYGLGDAVGQKSGGLFSGEKISGMLQVFGGNLMTKAAGMAVGLASEIGDAVKQGIELAKQGEGIRIAFERLGRGDILQGLREATHGTMTDLELMKAAVQFNDFKLPLEELGTMLAFAQQKAKDTGQSVDYMASSIVTGLGRKSLMILDNLGLSAAEIKDKMKETGDMTKAVGEIIREQMSKAGDYVETAADRATQADVKLKNAMEELGRTFQPLTDAGTSMWSSLKVGALDLLNNAVKPLIQALSEAGALGQAARAGAGFNNLGGNAKIDRMIGRLGNGKTQGAYSIYTQQLGKFDEYINNKQFQIAAFGNDNSSIAQSAKQKLQTELDGALKMRAEYVKRAQELHNQVPSPYEPSNTTTGGGGGRLGGSSKNLPEYFDFSKVLIKNESQNLKAEAPFTSVFEMLKGKSEFDPENILGSKDAWENYKNTITDSIGGIGDSFENLTSFTKNFDPYQNFLDQQNEKLTKLKTGWQMAASAISMAGNALTGLKNPAIDIMLVMGQAAATIGLAYAETLAKDSQSKSNIYAFIAAAAAATVSMVTTLASLHSATGYAEGGIVKGNSYSGDNIGGLVDGSQLVGLNAGEVVLTKAMQSNLANQLQGNGLGNMQIVGVLKGENMYLMMNRYTKRSGKGEIVTWGG